MDAKILSKAVAKKILPSVNSPQQSTYLNRIINEGDRLISDILEINSKQKIYSYDKKYLALIHSIIISL